MHFLKLLTLVVVLNISNSKANLISDSLQVKSLFKRAFSCNLYSQERQLILDSILNLEHHNAWAWQQKAMPLYKHRKYDLANSFIDSAVKYQKRYEWTEYRAYMYCIFVKDYRKAILEFDECEKINQGGIVMDHTYLFYKSLCLLMLNRFNEAELLIRKSVEFGEARIGVAHYLEYFYLGVTLYEENKTNDALLNFNKAISFYPHFSDAYYYKALCFQKLEKKEEMHEALLQANDSRKKGYGINEDGAMYEIYPYQVRDAEIKNKLRNYIK